jgi:hypothetical protein
LRLAWITTIAFILACPASACKIEVICNTSLYPQIEAGLATYIEDATSFGDDVHLRQVEGLDKWDLRDLIRDLYDYEGIDGVLLVGDMPVAWYEYDWIYSAGDGPPLPDLHGLFAEATFPIDLFYMELDATWVDQNDNGYFDKLVAGEGDLIPEIFVARITCGPLGDEAQLTNDYLQRVHDYKHGLLVFPDTALMYVDDDWASWGNSWGSAMAQAYPDATTIVKDPVTTSRADYLQHICSGDGYEFINVCSHAYSGGHGFYVGDEFQWVRSYEIPSLNPQVGFYNMFSCSFARYTDEGYGGGQYAFNTDYGLACVGSTKTGSMLVFQKFYQPLGQGACLGEAYWRWWKSIASNGFDADEIGWHFGMTLLGDPLLVPQPLGPQPLVAPDDFLLEGWNWISFPAVPDDPDPLDVLGIDAPGLLWRWDKYAKAAVAYRPPFSDFDLAVGEGYLMYCGYDHAPPSFWPTDPGSPFEFTLGRMGWVWLGKPGIEDLGGDDFMNSVCVRYPSDPEGQVRTAAEDYASADPWIAWGWSWFNNELQAPDSFTPYAPFGNNVCWPWTGYRAWIKVGSARSPEDPDQVTLIWP